MSAQPQRTSLLLNWSDKKNRPPLTAYRKCGARRAMAIGLQEYLEDVSAMIAGTKVLLQKVVADWAAPEEIGKYPGASVFSSEPCSFDANNFNSYLTQQNEVPGLGNATQGMYLAQTSEAECRLTLQVTCTDPVQRGLVEGLLEDVLTPSDDYYGLGLILPHYHNQLCVYELQSVTFEDDAGSARENLRVMTYELDAQLAVGVLRAYQTSTDKTFRVITEVEAVLLPTEVGFTVKGDQ